MTELTEADGRLDDAAKLWAASPHWIRYSVLTLFANEGVHLKILQETAGHASLSTTGAYLHVDDRDRHDVLS